MEKSKIALVTIAGIALVGVGFFLGILWSGHFFRGLYSSVNTNSASIDRVSGKIANDKMAESGIEQPAADSPSALGDSYFEAGNYAEAAKQYKIALDADPNDPDTQNDLGLALYYSGKTDEAIITLQKAARAFPNFQRIQLSAGFVLMGMGHTADAVKYLKVAYELDPKSTVGVEAERFLKMIEEGKRKK